MVSLRDGKSYDPGTATDSIASDAVPQRPRRAASAPRAGPMRRSTRQQSAPPSELSSGDFEDHADPPTPTSAAAGGKGAKRGRSALAPRAPIVEEELEDTPPRGDTSHVDQGLAEAAAIPLSPGGSPSPTPKKRARTAPRGSSARRAGSRRTGLGTVLAGLALLAAAAAVGCMLRPDEAAAARDALARGIASARAAAEQSAQLSDALAAADAAAAVVIAAGGQLLTAARVHASVAEAHMHSVLLQLHVRYPSIAPEPRALSEALASLLARARSVTDWRAASSGAPWRAEPIAALLPPGPQWQALAADAAELLSARPAARSHKAAGLLLACSADADCEAAAAALTALPPAGASCTLEIDSAGVGLTRSEQPAAALQAALAPFLSRCPAGLVLLRNAHALPPAALSALHAGLSELGGFQHGGRVDAAGAAFVLLARMPANDIAAAVAESDTVAASSALARMFFDAAGASLERAARAAGGGAAEREAWAAVSRSLASLPRRIDITAPLRPGIGATAAR
jgi:hypothetical protein